EDLIEMFGRQISLCAAGCDRLLRAHHDRVAEAAQQHDERQYAIHDADALVVDRGQPFAPQIEPGSLHRDESEDSHHDEGHERRCAHDDRLMKGNRAPIKFAKEIHRSALCDVEQMRCDGSSAVDALLTMPLNRSSVTVRYLTGDTAWVGLVRLASDFAWRTGSSSRASRTI